MAFFNNGFFFYNFRQTNITNIVSVSAEVVPKEGGKDGNNKNDKKFYKNAKTIAKMKLYAKPTPQENARCKVCFKKFQPQEFFRLCTICERKVCEDCSASYANKEPEVGCE